MRKANMKIRVAMMEHGLTQYDLAKLLGLSEMTMYRRLRDELPEKVQDAIITKIEEASK